MRKVHGAPATAADEAKPTVAVDAASAAAFASVLERLLSPPRGVRIWPQVRGRGAGPARLRKRLNELAEELERLRSNAVAPKGTPLRSPTLERIFDESPVPMWVFDQESLAFLEVNAAAVEHYGYSRDEFLRMRITDIRPPEEVARLLAEMRRPLPARRQSGPWLHRKKNGEIISVEINTHFLYFQGRKANLVMAQDVTERVESERKLLEFSRQLETRVAARTAELQQVNSELEAFASAVAHDLRAPLRALDGLSQALIEDFGSNLPERAKEYLLRIRRACGTMGRLIEDLLLLSRVSRSDVRKQRVDLSALARDVLEARAGEIHDRTVRWTVQDGLTVWADARLLRLAIEHLVDNALKFSSRRTESEIAVGAAHEGSRPVYWVRDNGAGFDMAYVDKLFQPFQRLHTQADFPGTGIGLATVHRVITKHGGQIWARARPDAGATFFFTLSGEGGADDVVSDSAGGG